MSRVQLPWIVQMSPMSVRWSARVQVNLFFVKKLFQIIQCFFPTAHLCACAIATLLKRMRREFCTVGVDGSVYRFHPTFKFLLDEKIGQLAGENQVSSLLEKKFEKLI